MQDLIKKIEYVIGIIYEKDSDLLFRDNYEVTISCKMSQYLFSLFPDYDVDGEYNKHIDDPKKINGRVVRPDILVHKRGTDENNLICIEVKKETNLENRNKDYNKLLDFTDKTKGYGYKLGVFIDFGKEKAKIIYFSEGKQLGN